MSHCFRVVAAVDRRNPNGVAVETGAANGVVAGIGPTICETVPIVPRIAAFRVLMDVPAVCLVFTSSFCCSSAVSRSVVSRSAGQQVSSSARQRVSKSAGQDISTSAHQWVSCEFGKSEAGEHCDRGIDIHCRPLGQDYEDGPRFPHCSSSASRRGSQGWQTVAEFL